MFSEIVKGCRKHNRDSQKELYKLFYGYGMSITLRYADSRNEAAAILNDAFMKVFENITQFDNDRPFKPWFRRIVINTSINEYNRNQIRRQQIVPMPDGQQLTSDNQIISGISYDEIIELIQKLTPAYRTVFNLYVIEGYKHKEISKMLKISVGTSKSNLSKAKQKLRTLLEKNLA